jgi:putative transposase
MDFVHDQLATGRKLRVLTIVDTFSRYSPALEPRFTFRGADVVEVLERAGRQECLNSHWFMSLADAREKLEDWRRYYNEERPHGAIGQRTPISLLNHAGTTSPPA